MIEIGRLLRRVDENVRLGNCGASEVVGSEPGALPPIKGFWSLTLYNQNHFFEPNDLKRYSLGTKNKSLQYNADGSLTLYVQASAPADNLRSNWLPAPKDGDFTLYIRSYWPEEAILDGTWTPPGVEQMK